MNEPIIYTKTATTSYSPFTSDLSGASGTLFPASGASVFILSNDGEDADIPLPASGLFFHATKLSSIQLKVASGTAAVYFVGYPVTR